MWGEPEQGTDDGWEIASSRESMATDASRPSQRHPWLAGVITLLSALFTFLSHSPGALAANQSGVIK